MPKPKQSTTERGLGWPHRQAVAALMRKLVDGSPCWWCGLPMFKDAARNWDCRSLAGDHTVPRVSGGKVADRLLHSRCNSQRRDGRWDTERPAVTGMHPDDWHSDQTPQPMMDTTRLAMDW